MRFDWLQDPIREAPYRPDEGTPLTGGGGARESFSGASIGGGPDPGDIKADIGGFLPEEAGGGGGGLKPVRPEGYQPETTNQAGASGTGPGGEQAGGASAQGGAAGPSMTE